MTNANGKDSEASCHISINFIYPVRGTLKKINTYGNFLSREFENISD